MYSLGKKWKLKIFSNGFYFSIDLYEFYIRPVNRLVWNHPYFEKIALNKFFWDAPENFPIELCT